MTPKEISQALKSLQTDAGIHAYTSLDVGTNIANPVAACLYPFGITSSHKGYLRVEGSEFSEVVTKLQEAWANHQKTHEEQIIKTMALAIIRLTTEIGEANETALRQDDFDTATIRRYGDVACEMATKMAGKGPFKIKRARGANAA